MSGHTPGPWELVPPKPSDEGCDEWELNLGGFKAGEKWICTFGDSTSYYPSEGSPPSEADARLIAAAPELLEALREYDEFFGHSYRNTGGVFEPMQAKARAAIAKATQP